MARDFHLSNFLPYLLNQAAEQASQKFAAVYRAEYGLQRTDWRVLAHLGEFGKLSAREICDRAGEHKTRVSRAVSRLEEMGIIYRAASRSDRRKEVLELTIRGLRIYGELTELAKKADEEFAEQLGASDSQALKATLSKLARLHATG